MSKKKRKRRPGFTGRHRVVVIGGEPKMSEVLLELADPLIDGDVSDPDLVDILVQLTIAAWNKSMLPVEHQAEVEREIIDTFESPDGDAERVDAIADALEIIEDRRRKLFPDLRRFVLNYDVQVSGNKVELNVVSESMSENR